MSKHNESEVISAPVLAHLRPFYAALQQAQVLWQAAWGVVQAQYNLTVGSDLIDLNTGVITRAAKAEERIDKES